ncbi:MAG: hypothetical protein M1323_07475 [Candidatus Thermoplasmatota archaeon]|jgi:Kef-type K+ transport system membrane component KefB|nr:hypothetical protein [Candidatus Thermoplasmatota archaeon]
MRPVSNRIMVPVLVLAMIAGAINIYEGLGLGTGQLLLNLSILSLTTVACLAAIIARINWEKNEDYQKNASRNSS